MNETAMRRRLLAAALLAFSYVQPLEEPFTRLKVTDLEPDSKKREKVKKARKQRKKQKQKKKGPN
jgi:hypothetical protein